MPGSKTVSLLASGDYETFYQLAHALSEYVLIRIIGIGAKMQVLAILHAKTDPDIFSNSSAAKSVGATAGHLRRYTQRVAGDARRFFWPRLATERGFHEANQQRWAPYDGAAWDHFFADYIAFMKPRLENIATSIERLKRAADLSGTAVMSSGTEHHWNVGEYIPDEPYSELEGILTEAGFESVVLGDD
jgi:hypothetical protein